MKALQLHYTSCRRGLSGGAGFQTRCLSPGIRLDEQREIERRGIYRPPRDARREATVEELARDFPAALRWYRLASGRWALTRSRYSGRDYSGRWGNFFAHTLVFEAGQPAGLWPVDLFDWPGWIDRLRDEEDGAEPPPPLPAADLEGPLPAESFRLAELRRFLCEEPDRTELLARMGRAVLLGAETSRAVVIRDTPAAGLYWVACLQKLFPPAQARELTCSTYQDDPRGAAAVNATTGETDFTFDEDERRFRFFMFDMTAGVHSAVPEVAGDYPAVAARWLVEEPVRLAELGELMRLLEPRRPQRELSTVVDLLELLRCRPAALSGERLVAAAGYATRHATEAGRARLVEAVAEVATAALAPRQAEPLIGFLITAAASSGQAVHRARACGAWLELLRGSVIEGGEGLAEARAAWESMHRAFAAAAAAEVGAAVLAGAPWSVVVDGSRPVSCETGGFLLRVATESLAACGRHPAWEQPEVARLAAALLADDTRGAGLSGHARLVLAIVPREPAAVAAVALRLAARWRTGEAAGEDAGVVGRALAVRLASETASDAADVRRRLTASAAWDLLIGEWLELCERAADPVAAFEEYRRTVLDPLPDLAARCSCRVAAALLARVPARQRPRLALGWLLDGFGGGLPEELLAELAQDAGQAVSPVPDREELVRELSRLSRRDLERVRSRLGSAGGATATRWDDLLAAVAERRRGPWSRFVAALGRRHVTTSAERRSSDG